MELIKHKRVLRPFVFRGHQCIVTPVSRHVIRIFYDYHVYEVLFDDKELLMWCSSGTDWQREYIRNLLCNELMNTEAIERHASIEDGFLA